jgi:hypothetical protein
MGQFLGALIVLIVLSSSAVQADFCADPRIVAEIAKFKPTIQNGFSVGGPGCSVRSAPFREAGEIHTIPLAWVVRTARWDYDLLAIEYDVFALVPDNQILNLGHFRAIPAPSMRAEAYSLESLGIDASRAGGTAGFPFDLIFTHVLERRESGLCVVYTMSTPFRGEFLDCNGYDEPTGDVGYEEGIISWSDAREISCQQLKMATGKPCGTPYNGPLHTYLMRDETGGLYWDTTVRSLVRVVEELRTPNETPVHYELHRYRVDLVGGKVTLLLHEDQPVPGEKL